MAMRQKQLRIDDEIEADMEAIRDYLAGQGLSASDSDVMRWAIRQQRIGLNLEPIHKGRPRPKTAAPTPAEPEPRKKAAPKRKDKPDTKVKPKRGKT